MNSSDSRCGCQRQSKAMRVFIFWGWEGGGDGGWGGVGS